MSQQQQIMATTAQVDTLEAMRLQEQAYMCGDYLYQECNSHTRDRMNMPQNGIDVSCRTSMMVWMKTVVKFIGFDTETVEISMSYLDRFLQTETGVEAKNCRTVFQLAAMTALYTAVKINCAEALTPKLLAELSQGAYTEDQFEEMERIMLTAIQWRVNPCTAVSFVRETVDLLPNTLFQTEGLKQAVIETAKTQAEWAVEDYDLLTVKKSVVAFAAISNSLRRHGIRLNLQHALGDSLVDVELDLKHAILIQKTLREALPVQPSDEEIAATPSSEGSANSMEKSTEVSSTKQLSWWKSPRSVVYRNIAA